MIVVQTIVVLFLLLFIVLPLVFIGLLSLTGVCSFELHQGSLMQRIYQKGMRLFSMFIK